MSSISSRRLSRSSLSFLPFLASSPLPAPDSSPSAGLLGLVSFFFCSAMGPYLLASSREADTGLDGGEHDPLLALVLPLPIRVRRQARLVRLEKQHLGDALVGVDLRGQRRGVADFQRHEPFPLGLEGRHVGDDAATGVGGLPHADGENVAGDLEVLDGASQRERVGGDDADVALEIDERPGIERLGIDEGVVDVGEDLELVGDTQVVSVGGDAVRDHPLADLPVLERLDHALLEGHLFDPPIAFDHVRSLRLTPWSPVRLTTVMVLPRPRRSQATGSQVTPATSTASVTPRPAMPLARSAASMAEATASPGPATGARRDGPAPLSTQPTAPAPRAAATAAGSQGKRPQRWGWCRRSSSAAGRRSRRPALSAPSSRPMRWRLNTASARDTESGSTARASLVEPSISGMSTTHRMAGGTGSDSATTRTPVLHDTVSPPRRAAATLSGWPSARVASSSKVSRERPPPDRALPATSPPIQAAALEPMPRLGGMRFTQRSATPRNGRPAASKAMRTARATTLRAPVSSRPAPSPSIATATWSASSASISLCSAKASPSTSKPGPRLAEVAGTRTRTRMAGLYPTVA